MVTGSNTTLSERSGVGDLTATGGWILCAKDGPIPGVELARTVKLPTAGSELGTGRTDFTAQANLFHSLTPTTSFIGLPGLGSPIGLPLFSGARVTAGVNFKPQDNVAFGALIDCREKCEAASIPTRSGGFCRISICPAYSIVRATNSARLDSAAVFG